MHDLLCEHPLLVQLSYKLDIAKGSPSTLQIGQDYSLSSHDICMKTLTSQELIQGSLGAHPSFWHALQGQLNFHQGCFNVNSGCLQLVWRPQLEDKMICSDIEVEGETFADFADQECTRHSSLQMD